MYRNATKVLVTAGLLLAVSTACGDLTVAPKSSIGSANIFSDAASYRAFLAKLYGGLVVTGQSGPAGSADLAGIDEGFSQYMREYWNLQELPTDEAIIAWGDVGLPEMNTQTWSSANPFVTVMYSRVFYQIALVNQFMRETTDQRVSSRGNATAELKTLITQYRAEARFLRALSYWHALDLYGPVPIIDENTVVSPPPSQKARAEVFAFVESELKAVRPLLPAKSVGDNYARASQAAVDMVLAHLYLNAKVYTGSERFADARVAAEAVIGAGFTLDPNYLHLFSADNNSSSELVFTVPQDGKNTQGYGNTTYLVHAALGGDLKPADYGVDYAWGGIRLRPETVDRFAVVGAGAPDQRAAYFFTNGQSKSIASISDYKQGYAAPKYRNKTSAGQNGSDATFPDTDFPMFRLADAYLIYAEAVLRGGGGDRATAVNYVNLIRQRAYGNATGNIVDAQLTLPFILDERSRELLWEGFRRQDLVRFGQFSDAGIWQWKGNVQAGKLTDKKYDLYPIPSNELSANPNMRQNPGY